MPQSETGLRDTGIPPLGDKDAAVLPKGADQFSWSPEQKLVAHRHMNLLFPSQIIHASQSVFSLNKRPDISVEYSTRGDRLDIDGYMKRTNVTGLLAIKNGEIVLERYDGGNNEKTVWASRSMAKSITSTLLGIAFSKGLIKNLDEPVSVYVPELTGTMYEKVTIRQNLQMTSGIPYTEDTLNPSTDIFPLQACTLNGRKGDFVRFLVWLGSKQNVRPSPAGSVFNYSTADSVLNGLIVERATGLTPPAYLEQEVWQRFGMERDGFWNMESEDGSAFAGSGVGACLRDYGRFGLFVLGGGGLPDGNRLLNETWRRDMVTPSSASLDVSSPYGFQWWLHEFGDVLSAKAGTINPSDPQAPAFRPRGSEKIFYALGSSGQTILINPSENLVIVKWAVWNGARSELGRYEDAAFFAAITERLH
ncbi:serine hydrolase domain-containing protein [Rhizobium puerariae]|uniref:Serine hydrolase domain-containing protein n=1 Tax=Rhizobium puerariae TaxID=1585791 RepID=A0ABV6AQ18_9HYPH